MAARYMMPITLAVSCTHAAPSDPVVDASPAAARSAAPANGDALAKRLDERRRLTPNVVIQHLNAGPQSPRDQAGEQYAKELAFGEFNKIVTGCSPPGMNLTAMTDPLLFLTLHFRVDELGGLLAVKKVDFHNVVSPEWEMCIRKALDGLKLQPAPQPIDAEMLVPYSLK